MSKKNWLAWWVMTGAYVLMIGVNVLANILPINGITTGAVSDSYPNLFAPAGITFSIWGLIYLLLAGYIVYRWTQTTIKGERAKTLSKIDQWFITSSIINAIWIFAWHYRLIGLTVILMVGLLLCLIAIANRFNHKSLNKTDTLFTKIPFGIYFGWITVATIANVTTFLVSVDWDGFGVPDDVWMMIVLLVGVVIAIARTWHDRNLAYGLVPVWAYYGIWLKHTSQTGFNSNYPLVILTVLISLGLLLLSNVLLIIRKEWI